MRATAIVVVKLVVFVETSAIEVTVVGMGTRVMTVGVRRIIIEMIGVIVVVDREDPCMAIDAHRNIEILYGDEAFPLTRREHIAEFLVADVVCPVSYTHLTLPTKA